MEPNALDFPYTPIMNTALKFINSTGRHIFLTGKAGTGKTTFLKGLLSRTHKQVAIVAPTGIAALNAGGTTIHSQFLFPFGMFIPDRSYAQQPSEGANWYTENVLARRHPLNSTRKQVLRSIDLLIIDEVSMLRADLLDAIDYRLRAVRGNFKQAFGGVQLLLIGDLYQLPPVIKREEEARLQQHYSSPWFFESKALQHDGFTFIELDRIFRQRDDSFISILNKLRVNNPSIEDLAILNNYFQSTSDIEKLREVITLTTHNYKADNMNMRALQELNSTSHFFQALIENDFPESMYPVLERLELKDGAQIMFTRNDNEDGMYYNGKLATVKHISGDNVTVHMAGSDKSYTLKRAAWENKKYHINAATKELEDEVAGTFSQYPIKLAWAITVHKSQGLTFDKAVIDVGESFADGQVYVALSRLRSLDGLVLRTKVDARVVSTDKQIVSFDVQHNRPENLEVEIKSQQKEFLKRHVAKTFDFDNAVREVAYILKGNPEASLGDKTMKPVLRQISDTLSAEAENTMKFREQLRKMLETDQLNDFLVRTMKGREYYRALLLDQLKLLAHHRQGMSSVKRVKGYLNDLADLDQLLTKKFEEVDKVFHMAETIIKQHDQFDFSILNTERASLLTALALKTGKASNGKVKTKKGKRKKEGTKDKNTYDISLALANSGLTVDEIAKERGLVRGTIEGHLAKAVEGGHISILKFMDHERVETITTALQEMHRGFTSNELYTKLNGNFTYGELRAVMNHTGIKPGSSKEAKEATGDL